MVSMNPYNFDILNIYGIDHRCIIKRISKSDALNSLKNADLSETKKIIIEYNFFLFCLKMSNKLM